MRTTITKDELTNLIKSCRRFFEAIESTRTGRSSEQNEFAKASQEAQLVTYTQLRQKMQDIVALADKLGVIDVSRMQPSNHGNWNIENISIAAKNRGYLEPDFLAEIRKPLTSGLKRLDENRRELFISGYDAETQIQIARQRRGGWELSNIMEDAVRHVAKHANYMQMAHDGKTEQLSPRNYPNPYREPQDHTRKGDTIDSSFTLPEVING